MEIEIHDTYVYGKKGQMHFDVAIEHKGKGNNNKLAVKSAKKWLNSIGEKNAKITSEECNFCHIDDPDQDIKDGIKKNGYAIIKMSGCPK